MLGVINTKREKMKAIENYEIIGNDGRIINSIFWKNTEIQSKKLAIIFPGYRYPTEGPLNFYLKILFNKYGYDVLSIDYRYNENTVFQSLNDAEKDQYFESDQKYIFQYIRDNYQEKSITFIGKSLGTSAIYEIVKNNINNKIIKDSIYLWLTPATKNKEIVDICVRNGLKSFYTIGENDPFFDKELISTIDIDTFEKLIIMNAGHVLETEKDLEISIDNVKNVIIWIEKNIKLRKMGL